MSAPLVSHGMVGGLGSGGGSGNPPGQSTMELLEVGTNWAKFAVVPPFPLTYYVGTKILYCEVGDYNYLEAGPEVGGEITVPSLTPEMIYVFLPVAYGTGGVRAKPGNVILATAPINIIDMDQLQLNSCGLVALWEMINRKTDRNELTATLDRMTSYVQSILSDRSKLDTRLEILEREIAILRRKLAG